MHFVFIYYFILNFNSIQAGYLQTPSN